MSLGFLDREGQANATLGIRGQFLELALAAATSMDLALDHIKRAGQLLGRRFRFIRREDRNAFGDGSAEALQQSFALIFMNVHDLVLSM